MVPESAGLAEESTDERRVAKKAFFPSSMGLSLPATKDTRTLTADRRLYRRGHADAQGDEEGGASCWPDCMGTEGASVYHAGLRGIVANTAFHTLRKRSTAISFPSC